MEITKTYKGADGRTVEIVGTASQDICAKVLKKLIDKRLEEQAREIASRKGDK